MATREDMKGNNLNPTGKGGFGDNPQNRHNGAWKKEDTPRYKLEQMMKLSEKELLDLIKDENAPYFERKLAKAMNKSEWKELEGMINQTYGYPESKMDMKVNDDSKPLIKGFVIPTLPEDFIQTDKKS